jgi:hypothetical protein
VRDHVFYNAGCGGGPLSWPLVACRRLLRRLLRPFFDRQVELARDMDKDLTDLGQRHEALERQVKHLAALGWDQVAFARRLAALEDRVEALQRSAEDAHEAA